MKMELLRYHSDTALLVPFLLLVGCGDSAAPGGDAGRPMDAATNAAADAAADAASVALPDASATLDTGKTVDVRDPFDPSLVDAGVGSAPPTLTANVTLHIAGDSTAAIFPATDPRVGWGAVLENYFGAGVTIHDAAQSGRSSKSFIDEGFWASVKTTIKPGDYVFIEFGHNDEKFGDTARYTIPNTSYRYYLKTYIAETRALGGFAVLLTSIARRQFSGATVPDSHAAYTAAVLAVGAETGTPVLDLQAKTNAWLTTLGAAAAVPYFAPGDSTHLNAQGAMAVAGMVARGIAELGLPIAERIVEPVDGGVSGEAGVDVPEQEVAGSAVDVDTQAASADSPGAALVDA